MSAHPVVALIGRPNVGKSSLFNRLIRRREAIVAPVAGTTRDRHYAPITLGRQIIELVDTAGLSGVRPSDQLSKAMLTQVQEAVAEADMLVFLVDGRTGLTEEDRTIAEQIRRVQTPTVVFINKIDRSNQAVDASFKRLGLGPVVIGSAVQGRGIVELQSVLESRLIELDYDAKPDSDESNQAPSVALIGRPNVGKSTLFNAIIGEERAIVSDIPGTTRDTVDSLIELSTGEHWRLIDTAGLRRRGKIGRAEPVERYSVIRTLRAIDQADLVILVADALEGLTRGDVHAAMHATELKKPLITVINKIDLKTPQSTSWRRFPFIVKRPMIFLSALDLTTIEPLLELIRAQLHNKDEKQAQSSQEGIPPARPGL